MVGNGYSIVTTGSDGTLPFQHGKQPPSSTINYTWRCNCWHNLNIVCLLVATQAIVPWKLAVYQCESHNHDSNNLKGKVNKINSMKTKINSK